MEAQKSKETKGRAKAKEKPASMKMKEMLTAFTEESAAEGLEEFYVVGFKDSSVHTDYSLKSNILDVHRRVGLLMHLIFRELIGTTAVSFEEQATIVLEKLNAMLKEKETPN